MNGNFNENKFYEIFSIKLKEIKLQYFSSIEILN